MKSVMAIIRINMMNETKRALSAAGITSMTATGNAFGRGKGLWDAKVMDAARKDVPEAIEHLGKEPRLRPQRVLTVTVPDNKVKLVVDTIMKTNCTKSPGDGKIFVMPEVDAIRIRTGERGDSVLD
ncbi:P-II family nitrogen regulator [Saccharicrinis sp. FJH54]|uniref:P-II family nitrogen regulator n=1 Tax=Saccharicrinis sp. FJH54 TaxID=3344665 RepID=UPI0035D46366